MSPALNHGRSVASAGASRVPYKPLSLFRFVILPALSGAVGSEARFSRSRRFHGAKPARAGGDLAVAFVVYFRLLTFNYQLSTCITMSAR